MKKITFFLIVLIASMSLAQNGINYKAVIKDNNGNVVANQGITVEFNILKGVGQSNVYKETHTPTTDANGIIVVNIGEGTPVSGTFSTIAWGSDSHWLNVKVNSGNGLVDMGTTEFKAVPYALNVTGLEKITESGNTGWRLKGQDPDQYGTIGFKSIDLSLTNVPSSIYGATGDYAFASGLRTEASGPSSIAMGFGSKSSGIYSIAIGYNPIASGGVSTAFGNQTLASGSLATAAGSETKAESLASTAMGQFNVGGGNPTTWIATDPLFEIGNGTANNARKNALTVYKNGNMKIGGNANLNDGIASGIALSVNGSEAIWYNGTYFSWGYGGTANLFADNVGIGIVAPNVALDVNGSIEYTGTITGVSDERLKENFLPIENVLTKLQGIQGYSYNMKGDENMNRQYGVIAQELQKVFPEMVSTVDTDKGYLGVSYIQLIPVLLEAIKEQQDIIESQKAQIKDEKQMNAFQNEQLQALINRLEIIEKRQFN